MTGKAIVPQRLSGSMIRVYAHCARLKPTQFSINFLPNDVQLQSVAFMDSHAQAIRSYLGEVDSSEDTSAPGSVVSFRIRVLHLQACEPL